MITDDLWAIPGGIVGGAFWMWMLRAMLGGSSDADVRAFKAMTVLMLLACLVAAAFPRFSIGGWKAIFTTLGYLIVMAWFWKDRRLALIARERTDG